MDKGGICVYRNIMIFFSLYFITSLFSNSQSSTDNEVSVIASVDNDIDEDRSRMFRSLF